jgi:CBS domain containing-hemolysin-like protein
MVMKNIFRPVIKFFVWIWDFIFFFFGFTYEKQATKLDLDEMEPTLRGPENEKTGHQYYRANKVKKED